MILSIKKKIILLNIFLLIFNIKEEIHTQNYINLNDEFSKSKNIKKNVKCLYYKFYNNIGNALLILNNLINVCENINCKYIITSIGLKELIKNPIFYKEKNIIILPYSYKYKANNCLLVGKEIFKFRYTNKLHKIRLNIIKNEIINNLPRYNANPNDLYINIRSGDIFIHANKKYAQPPLCFYQKIINENKNNYSNIYLFSNGLENPVISKLLNFYPKIKFIHGYPLYDASILVNVYNLILPVSSFTYTLIRLNNNLRKIYIYDIMVESAKIFLYGTDNYFKFDNFSIYKMKPSKKYLLLMKGKWKNTKEQKDLMIKENCINSNLYLFKK